MHNIHIDNLNKLEGNGDWDGALGYSVINKSDEDVMARIIFYGWYLKLEFGCVDNCSEIIGNRANRNLFDVFETAINSCSYKVLAEIGYGMNIVSYYFPGDVDVNEKLFLPILKKAYDLSDGDVVCAILLTGAGGSAPINISKAKYDELISNRYGGIGEYNSYYRSVLINRISG